MDRYSLKLGALGEAAEAAFVLRDIDALSRWDVIYDLILNTLVFKFRHSSANMLPLSFSGWRVLQVETVTCWIRLQDLRRDYMQGRDNSTSASSPDRTQILDPSRRIINNSPELS